MVKERKKRENPEDFIGWRSPDGKLEVVDIIEKSRHTKYKVTCTECSKDPELFPLGYFVSTKSNLKNGQKPCGCSKKPEWKHWQYLILARRLSEGRFIVHDFSEEFKGVNTRLNLECLKDGYRWTSSVHNVINGGRGCPKCYGNAKPTEQEALQRCIDICKEMNYDAIGFPKGYKNKTSRFEYNCKIHGKQNVSYNNFVNNESRCGDCARDESSFYGYYPERKDEVDFLYVLNFNDQFIKVGRSFDVDERIKGLRTASKIPKKKIHKLRIFTATHQEIYDLEQELHGELRERNFQYYVNWSTECFQNESLYILNKMLDSCDLEEVKV